MSNHTYMDGTWEVIKCESANGSLSVAAGNYDKLLKCMEGVRVRLDDNGDVTWTAPEELKSVPLFTCETYELHSTCGRSGLVLRFGAYAGHVFEFRPEKWSKENVTLTCEGFCTLHCIKVKDESSEVDYSAPFTLLPALEDGYFSDVIIMSSNRKQFKVHSTILELQGDDIDWMSDPPPFNGLPEEVLGTILHFLYAECLPDNLTEETARQVISAASPYESLSKLVSNCQLYLKNMALKQQIIGIVGDMHNCINQLIERFNTRSNPPGDSISGSPAKLCFVVKQSIRDAAVVSAKLILLCDLFTKRKGELTRHERHEIIRYAKSRLPVFIMQLTKFLQALKSTFSSMSSAQRMEIASFLVPEIEVILDTISMLIVHVEKTLQQIIQGLFTPDSTKCKSNVGDMISKTIRNILHIRELTKLNTLHEHITFSLGLLVHKKENFIQMSSSQKIRSIARNLEQLIEELPIFLIKLEETASVFDDRLGWRDFKFCFKVGTSKISDVLQKLLIHVDDLQDVMLQLCELVRRDEFTQTLQCLGLLNATGTASDINSSPNVNGSPTFSPPKHQTFKLNLVKSLCVPADANKSVLSQHCAGLLASGAKADMEFEVVDTNEAQRSDGAAEAVQDVEEEKCVVKAHRVIVAARCDWFRRALLSGMREAIDRKIVVHDTSPHLFKILLEYLYSGRLDRNTLSTEQLVELLLLGDRYEMDSLKQTCEYMLVRSIDSEVVLYLLSVADQYNARILKSRCLSFISRHHELTESEEFIDLPITLQAQIFNDYIWGQPTGSALDFDFSLEHLLPTSSDTSPGVNEVSRGLESMLLVPDPDQSNSSLDDFHHADQTSSRMDNCISQLRDIVGETASRNLLVQVILAADFDLRRAVNYYYARTNEDE
ncbi:unnamed protein product [Phaedon cochleariae]|uniref:BTB domain-containing protein n=1 Tax=Phaedon cochleariae TaxID=80249 RepID=A0A9N9SEY9_PHACE|nr:unnamed protein product [Phaedon cochleariae]